MRKKNSPESSSESNRQELLDVIFSKIPQEERPSGDVRTGTIIRFFAQRAGYEHSTGLANGTGLPRTFLYQLWQNQLPPKTREGHKRADQDVRYRTLAAKLKIPAEAFIQLVLSEQKSNGVKERPVEQVFDMADAVSEVRTQILSAVDGEITPEIHRELDRILINFAKRVGWVIKR